MNLGLEEVMGIRGVEEKGVKIGVTARLNENLELGLVFESGVWVVKRDAAIDEIKGIDVRNKEMTGR